ncbi:MAG: hypothetical protein IJZ56_02930 [Oscillospiraceae bacterium]|nr:hypothetical protein [Oscillospiraceae bacterium]
MGCIMEFLIELFFEGLIELIGYSYVKVVSWILPKHKFSEKLRQRIKTGVLVVFVIAFLTLIIGVGILSDGEPGAALTGRYMTVASLAVIGVPLVLGVLVKVITILRKKQSEKDKFGDL